MLRQQRKRRKQMAEINVVPYIDVMLVLLVIFMITAPLLTQGVNVNLPKVESKTITPDDNEPVVVSVDRDGRIYIDSGDHPDEPVSSQDLVNTVAAFLRNNPNLPIYIKGDSAASYGQVVSVMALLQKAGVPNVGMLTKPPQDETN